MDDDGFNVHWPVNSRTEVLRSNRATNISVRDGTLSFILASTYFRVLSYPCHFVCCDRMASYVVKSMYLAWSLPAVSQVYSHPQLPENCSRLGAVRKEQRDATSD